MRLLIAILFLFVQSLASASTLTCSYDSGGRLVNVNFGGSTNSSFTFDNNGNLLSQSTFVSGNPNLAISQSATPAPVVAGKPLKLTVTVFNNSSVTAGTVKLTNTLPANVIYLSNSVTQGSVAVNATVLTWTVGTLTNIAAAIMNVWIRPLTVGNLTNTALAVYVAPDPYPADNQNVFVTSVVGAPEAFPALAAGLFSISWSIAGGENYTVQYADNLSSPTIWTPLPVDPAVFGDAFYVQDSVTNFHRFYRLVSP
jgi:uncharacterized repeat protein (TIGR01451 family)